MVGTLIAVRYCFGSLTNEELWLVNLETGDHTVLAFTNGPVQGAAISPDGGKVVYVDRDAEGNAVMYVVKTDGSDRRSLIGPGEWLYVFGWSADGRHILYYAGERSGTQGDLALSTADWDSRDSLWIMDVDNNERRPLFSPYIFGWGFEPGWSPDGRQVASTGLDTDHNFGCAQKPKGTVLDLTTCRLEGTAIYVEDISTGEVRRLAPGINPTWSPDGSMIAFLSGQSGMPQIWVIQAEGAESHQITIDLQQKSRIVWTTARR